MTGSPVLLSKFFLIPLSFFPFPLSFFYRPLSPFLFPVSSFLHFPDLSRKGRNDSARRVDCRSFRVLKILTGGQPEKSSVSQNMVSSSEPSVNQTLNLRSIKRFGIAWLLLINIMIVYISWFFDLWNFQRRQDRRSVSVLKTLPVTGHMAKRGWKRIVRLGRDAPYTGL